MLKKNTQQLRYFLFSQYLADGIRITLEIIIPVIFFAQFGKMGMGMTIATGAFCVSICDIPGARDSKRNGMLYCIGFIFIMSLLTGFMNHQVVLLGLLVAVSTFFFTMFTVYGNRAAAVGTAALLVMILRMPDIVSPKVAVTDSLLILAGGVWYLLLALIFLRLTPYRPAQRALGDCIHETAKFLMIKSELYDINVNFDDEYRKLVTQQIIVNEKQNAVRELLFKNKEILKEHSRAGRLLVLTFADAVDLYEQITATWYDYNLIREKFGPSGILTEVAVIIKDIAGELDNIGLAIQSNSDYQSNYALIPALDKLKLRVDGMDDKNNSNLVLKKILVNLRNLGSHVDELMNYFTLTISKKGRLRSQSDYSKFVSHQEINPVIFRNNLNLESGVFRHALRMMITCITGFAITKFFSYGHHSYWVLLTIIIILKPGFSLTKERNIQRFAGTLAGGIIGLLILYFIKDRNLLFAFIVFFMVGTYTFQRLNYIVMVIFITPYVLILLNLLGLGTLEIAEERLIDTGIAGVLSFLASYLLFPHWESLQLDTYMKKVLKANLNYLETSLAFMTGKSLTVIEYKLARKEVYISTANLSAAFNRMLSEPKNKQRNDKLIYEFVVLNHVLSSNIASLSAEMILMENKQYPREVSHKLRRSIISMREGLKQLDKSYKNESNESVLMQVSVKDLPPDKQLNEQLDFIYKVTLDINKLAAVIAKDE